MEQNPRIEAVLTSYDTPLTLLHVMLFQYHTVVVLGGGELKAKSPSVGSTSQPRGKDVG